MQGRVTAGANISLVDPNESSGERRDRAARLRDKLAGVLLVNDSHGVSSRVLRLGVWVLSWRRAF